jgi:hypothetical protein
MSEGKKMNHDEMMQFIAAVGRSELFEELKGLQHHHRGATEYKRKFSRNGVLSKGTYFI